MPRARFNRLKDGVRNTAEPMELSRRVFLRRGVAAAAGSAIGAMPKADEALTSVFHSDMHGHMRTYKHLHRSPPCFAFTLPGKYPVSPEEQRDHEPGSLWSKHGTRRHDPSSARC